VPAAGVFRVCVGACWLTGVPDASGSGVEDLFLNTHTHTHTHTHSNQERFGRVNLKWQLRLVEFGPGALVRSTYSFISSFVNPVYKPFPVTGSRTSPGPKRALCCSGQFFLITRNVMYGRYITRCCLRTIGGEAPLRWPILTPAPTAPTAAQDQQEGDLTGNDDLSHAGGDTEPLEA